MATGSKLNPEAKSFFPGAGPRSSYFPDHSYNNYYSNDQYTHSYPPPHHFQIVAPSPPPLPQILRCSIPHQFNPVRQFPHNPTVVTRPQFPPPPSQPTKVANPSRSSTITRRRGVDRVDYRSRGGGARVPMRGRLRRVQTWARRASPAQASKPSSSSRAEFNDEHGYIIGNGVTSLMIRNVPSKYTRKMMMEFLDGHCMRQNQSLNASRDRDHNHHHDQTNPNISAYDFLYLPIDFRSRLNKGYAFVNFTSPQGASKFARASDKQGWAFFQSSKIREIAVATIQGKDQLVKHFESMRFGCDDEDFLPVWFSPPRNGSDNDSVTARIVGNPIGYWNKHNS